MSGAFYFHLSKWIVADQQQFCIDFYFFSFLNICLIINKKVGSGCVVCFPKLRKNCALMRT
jgi:hypothetical protein